MGERMVVADMDRVEIYNHKLSELRQSFFESPDGGKLVSSKLPHIIGDLRTYVSHGSKQSKSVLGQALHLSSLLACHRMDYGTCLRDLNEMIDCACDLHDVDMEVTALIRQGLVSYYQFKPTQRHYTFRRARPLVEKIQSPLIRKQVFFGYAESIASSGQTELAGVERYFEAERHFDIAESLSVPSDDPGHVYFRWNHVMQATHRARFLVAHRKSRDAVELLKEVYNHDATPDNVEVLSILAQAYCHMILRQEGEDSFERACFFMEALVDAAKRMGSALHHSQAQVHYEFLMLSKWHREASERLLHVVAF